MDWIQGWAPFNRAISKGSGQGGGATEICFHYRVDCLNDAIQHNFHSLFSACCVAGVHRQSKKKRGLHLGDVTFS